MTARNTIVAWTFIFFVSVLSVCTWTYMQLHQFQSCPTFKTGDMEDKDEFVINIREVEENFTSLDQGDRNLVHYTRVKYLHPPSKLPYNLKQNDTEKMKTLAAEWVIKFFRGKQNGTFIEAGAYDGESISTTLYLEKKFGWTGVLVECSPLLSPKILSKHRKVWVANVCLAPKSKPGTFVFKLPKYDIGATIGKPISYLRTAVMKYFDVQAVPLYTIIAALGWKEVDYFSFDVEGIELELLRNFPFDKVIFKVIVIEMQYYNDQEKKEITSILAKNGYILVAFIPPVDNCYVHKSVMHLLPK